MIKNQVNIYQFVLRDTIGQGVTGLSPTVRIRKDTGSFATTTNTPTEVGNGLYEVALTAAECNCDIMAIEVSLPDGQFPAILTNEYMTSSGGATPQQIWEYTTRTLTASPTDISSLATFSDLSNAKTAIINAMPVPPSASTIATTVINTSVLDRDTNSLGATVLAVSGYTDEVESKIDSVSTKLTDLPIVRALLDHWVVSGTTLTCYDSEGSTLESCTLTKDDRGNIVAVTPNEQSF